MKKRLITKNILLGFFSWLIPFVISCLFFKPGGTLIVPYATFKSTIILVGVITGCYLLIRYFKSVDNDFIKNGIIVGLSWFAINLILDIFILIPLMKSNFTDYFMSIGLSYISIPVMSITMGYLLHLKVNKD